MEFFRSDIKPAIPGKGRPGIEVKPGKRLRLPQGSGNGMSMNNFLQINLSGFSIIESEEYSEIFDILRVFEVDTLHDGFLEVSHRKKFSGIHHFEGNPGIKAFTLRL